MLIQSWRSIRYDGKTCQRLRPGSVGPVRHARSSAVAALTVCLCIACLLRIARVTHFVLTEWAGRARARREATALTDVGPPGPDPTHVSDVATHQCGGLLRIVGLNQIQQFGVFSRRPRESSLRC